MNFKLVSFFYIYQYNADYWLSGRMVKLAWWQSAWTWNHLDIL